jgi:hypothetical protein
MIVEMNTHRLVLIGALKYVEEARNRTCLFLPVTIGVSLGPVSELCAGGSKLIASCCMLAGSAQILSKEHGGSESVFLFQDENVWRINNIQPMMARNVISRL